MLYWEDHNSYALNWKWIELDSLPIGETIHDRCASYCLSLDGCMAAMSNRYEQFDWGDENFVDLVRNK